MSSTNSPPHDDTNALLHQTTVALSQIHNLLRQATDIMAHLHTRFLHHIRQADPTFRQHFQQLPPPPPTYSINLPSPTSSCDSAPSRPRVRPPPPPSNNSDDTLSPSPPPQPAPARKRKQPPPPPPPLNPHADWDTWDGEADCRLVELKGNPRLRPNWIFVARRVGFSVEQCQARWKELKDLQQIQDHKPPHPTPPTADPERSTLSTQPLLSSPTHISPTPTSPAHSPPQPSQPDFSPSPMTTPRTPPEASPKEALPLQPAAERAPSENRHPERSRDTPIGSYFI